MDAAERLRERADIPNEQIPAIVARASALQDAERKRDRTHATAGEVERVAEELDIAPAHVEEAIRQLRAEQATAAADDARVRLWVGRGVIALAAAGLLAGAGVGGVGLVGASSLGKAQAEAALAETRLERALERQAQLAPQLVALAGGRAEAVTEAADRATAAADLDARRDAALILNREMAAAIGQVTAQGDDQAQQRLLNLQHEVVGSWNRIDTEQARYDAAVGHWRLVGATWPARVALTLGLAPRPG